MSDVGLIAIIVAFFGLAIWLVRVLGGLIVSGDNDGDGPTDEPPDTDGSSDTDKGEVAGLATIDPRKSR
jgi:hypothetical protein